LKTFVSESLVKDFVDAFAAQLPDEWLGSVLKAPSQHLEGDLHKSADFYTYQWRKYSEIDDPEGLMDERDFTRLTDGRLNGNTLVGKNVADVGGGNGRFSGALLDGGARQVTIFDLGLSIELAHKRFLGHEKVLCVHGDISRPPFKPSFDVVVCIGVLQHLPDPQEGFDNLVRVAAPGGAIFVWCYGRHRIRQVLSLLRFMVGWLPVRVKWLISVFPATVRYGFLMIGRLFQAIGREDISGHVPFLEYRGRSFRSIHVNTFDHLGTPIIDFFSRDQLEGLLSRSPDIDRFAITCPSSQDAPSSWIIEADKRA